MTVILPILIVSIIFKNIDRAEKKIGIILALDLIQRLAGFGVRKMYKSKISMLHIVPQEFREVL